MVITFLENALNLKYVFLLMPQSPQSKEIFENIFPQDERGEGNYDLLYFAEIWRWLATFVLYFSWFVIFLNVMALQFCE